MDLSSLDKLSVLKDEVISHIYIYFFAFLDTLGSLPLPVINLYFTIHNIPFNACGLHKTQSSGTLFHPLFC